jgi:hypothetical protein
MRNATLRKGKKVCWSKLFCLGVFLLIEGLALIGAGQLLAQEPYYKGKVLILLNNMPPGGSSDVWTRLQARHIARFIPGQPTVIVQNMPGANGITGYKWLTEVGKPDGLTVGCFGAALASEEAVGQFPKGTLSTREAEIIATLADTDVWFGRKAVFPQGYKSLLPPQKRDVAWATLKRDADYVRDASILNLFGLKKGPGGDYIQVYGYPGGNDVYLAMGRAEADVYATRVSGYRQTPLREVKAGNFIPLWQGGFYTETGQVIRDVGVKEIPTFLEVFTELMGKNPSGPYYDYFVWRTNANSTVRIVVCPPRTPKQASSVLTEAWRQMVKDPQFLSDQEKIFGTKEEMMSFGDDARYRIRKTLEKQAEVDKVYGELISK